MTDPQQLLRAVVTLLDDSGEKWALVGGLAVSVRTTPRFTQDIDLAVGVANDDDAERLVGLLVEKGFRTVAVVEQSATDRLAVATLSFSNQDDESLVDLIFAMSGIEREVVTAASVLEVLPGTLAPIAEVGHLIALKVLARDDDTRPQDLLDLRALLSVATEKDLSLTTESLRLITERGYNRGKDLLGDIGKLILQFRPKS